MMEFVHVAGIGGDAGAEACSLGPDGVCWTLCRGMLGGLGYGAGRVVLLEAWTFGHCCWRGGGMKGWVRGEGVCYGTKKSLKRFR